MFFIKNKSFLGVLATTALSIALFSSHCHANHWRLDAGLGSRAQAPIVLIGGVGYKSAVIRAQGMGIHNGPNDFWCSFRGSLLWTFFRDLPFNFDVGVGGGYEYAEAPNKMHQALNNANKGKYLYPYNYKEIADVSLEIWTHLYRLYTQISVPAYQFKEHDSNSILWGVGYMVEF